MKKIDKIDQPIQNEYSEIEMTVTQIHKKSLLCMVNSGQKLETMALKKLIEQLCEYAQSKSYESINVIFSSSSHALEDCRNAILLESMM